MKKTVFSTLLLISLPLIAQASCENVRQEIYKKIVAHGVAESSFTLSIVPSTQVEKEDKHIIGNCNNDTQKIIYQRTHSPSATNIK